MELTDNETLTDLLCLRKFNQFSPQAEGAIISRAIVAWAEHEVMAGNDSAVLLILASLGLDKPPKEDEVSDYLERYMVEAGLRYPGEDLSALVWLRMALRQMLQARSAREAENYLACFATGWRDSGPGFYSRACRHLSWLYYYLFDSYGGDYRTPAEELGEAKTLDAILRRAARLVRVLSNHDWLRLLAGEPLPTMATPATT